jgi:DNA mismatch endonuclease (patch repair protein)
MSRIRGKDTKPELAVRRALWAAGLRYRLHDKRLSGHPDLVFPARRTVVFVHGCFWHCHEGCANYRIPKTRADWWGVKLARNKTRDTEVRGALEVAGWRVIVIWECEVADGVRLDAVVNEIRTISRQERHTERN